MPVFVSSLVLHDLDLFKGWGAGDAKPTPESPGREYWINKRGKLGMMGDHDDDDVLEGGRMG